MLGSSPARITITMGYSQVAKAPVFDTGIAGSSPAIPAMIRYSSGSRGQSANLLVAGSNPARISIWSLRLVGQDASLCDSLRAALRAVARLHSAAALIKLEIRVRSTD